MLALLREARAVVVDPPVAEAARGVTPAAPAVSPRLLRELTGLNERLQDRLDELAAAEARMAARLDALEARITARVEAEVRRRLDAALAAGERRIARTALGVAERLMSTLPEDTVNTDAANGVGAASDPRAAA